jgi:hypothetical protein
MIAADGLSAAAAAFVLHPATTIFVSPCECQGFHGKNRWVTKTDLSPVPSDKSAIQPVTPSQIYAWEGLGPNVDVTDYTEARLPAEQNWYALTGCIVDAKVEADGGRDNLLEPRSHCRSPRVQIAALTPKRSNKSLRPTAGPLT